jgi:hypothetical protein
MCSFIFDFEWHIGTKLVETKQNTTAALQSLFNEKHFDYNKIF